MTNKLHMVSQKSPFIEDYSFLLGIIAFILIILGLFIWQTYVNSSRPHQNTPSGTADSLKQVSANGSNPEKVVDIRISNADGFSTHEVRVPKNTQLTLRFSRLTDENQGIFFPAHDLKSFQFGVGELTHIVVFEPFLQVGEHDFLASIYTGNLNIFKSMKGVIKVTE